jgi:uncharacterized protein
VKFWDASAIVRLLVLERQTAQIQSLARQDPDLLVWWASEVECVSALARREREGAFDARTIALALERLQRPAAAWHEVDPSDLIREAATRFLLVHALCAADAPQLDAAFVAAERRPASLEVVTLDEHLASAARKGGCGV